MIDIKKIALRAINSSRRTSPSTYIDDVCSENPFICR